MATLWNKGTSATEAVERFTVGNDRILDLRLARYDVMGSRAHIRMLESIGLLAADERATLDAALARIAERIEAGDFRLEDDVEDIHSQVELLLTRELGELGGKIHSGRSRNDQVLVDLKLYARARIERTVAKVDSLFRTLQSASEKYQDVLIPGYTHLQVAMPSSFGLWFGAYAESLTGDMTMLKAAWDIVNRNPLGSAAGYGSSAPLNRAMTTTLLGFDDLDYNSVYAQMTRGKMERAVAFAYSSVAETVGRLAFDGCLYSSQNFGFVKLPDALTTGSSIMPHKKNPDVFELVRARCNKICGALNDIRLITGNLPSGYFRDMQILKEVFFPIFDEMDSCLDIVEYAVKGMEVKTDVMSDPKYKLAFSVEKVNDLVSEGVPFRDAYRQVAASIADGSFDYSGNLNHTHEGSIGNLCNDRVAARMDRILSSFGFDSVAAAIDALVS